MSEIRLLVGVLLGLAGVSCGTSGGSTVEAQLATQLSIVTQPGGAVDGIDLTTQPVIQVRDAAGGVVSASAVSVTAAVASGTGTLTGTTTVAAVAGVATFTNLRISGVGTSQLTFTSSGLAAATSSSFAVAAAGGAGTVLFSEAFEDNNLTTRAWYDNSAPFTTVATEAHGGTRSLQALFNSGATGTSWVGTRHKFTPSTSVYLSYWVKYSANWVGSGQTFHPHEFSVFTTEDGDFVSPAFNHLTVYVEHNYQASGGFPRLEWADGSNIDQTKLNVNLVGVTEARAVAGCNGTADGITGDCYDAGGGTFDNGKLLQAAQAYFLPTPGTGYKNNWHHVEAYFQLNSIVGGIGRTDGIAQYWFDGTLIINRNDLQFRTGAHSTMMFNQLFLAPYIGNGSPVTQSAYYDDLLVKTAP